MELIRPAPLTQENPWSGHVRTSNSKYVLREVRNANSEPKLVGVSIVQEEVRT
jgi:hypothetical protein